MRKYIAILAILLVGCVTQTPQGWTVYDDFENGKSSYTVNEVETCWLFWCD